MRVLLTVVKAILVQHPVSALSYATDLINTHLDCSEAWTIESAADNGFLHLLDKLAANEWPNVGRYFRVRRFQVGAVKAAAKGDLPLLRWWMNTYLPDHQMTHVVYEVAEIHGQVHVVQWLCEYSSGPFHTELVVADMMHTHPDVVRWLDLQNFPFRLQVWMNALMENGDLAFLKWIHSNPDRFNIDCRTEAMTSAAIWICCDGCIQTTANYLTSG